MMINKNEELSINQSFNFVYRFLIYITIIVSIIIAGASIYEERQEIENKIINSSNQVNKIISYDMDYIKYQLYYASSQLGEMNGDKEKIQKLLTTFANNINNQIDIAISWNAFSWIDQDNKLAVDGTVGVLPRPIDISYRDYLKFSITDQNQLIFGSPVVGILSQQLIIPTAIKVFSRRNIYLGTLVFGFDIKKMIAKLDKITLDKNITFAFFQNDSYAFGSENFDSSSIDKIRKLITKEILEVDNNKQEVRRELLFSNKLIVYLQNLKNYPFNIAVFYDAKSYFYAAFFIIVKQLLITILLLLIYFVIFRLLYKKIINPILELSEFADCVIKNNYKYKINRPEIKELSQIFDALSLNKKQEE